MMYATPPRPLSPELRELMLSLTNGAAQKWRDKSLTREWLESSIAQAQAAGAIDADLEVLRGFGDRMGWSSSSERRPVIGRRLLVSRFKPSAE